MDDKFITISLCMIVLNEENTIAQTIQYHILGFPDNALITCSGAAGSVCSGAAPAGAENTLGGGP